MRVFEQCRRLAQRDPFLARHVKFSKKEAVYTTEERDPETGGRFKSDHVLRVIASGDIRGAHGMSPATCLLDEVWTQDTYDLIEPLTQSPARACPLTVYSSYSQLRSQAHANVPLYDLVARGRAGDDPGLLYSYLGKDDWHSVPWISVGWLDRVRRQLANAPARFARLIENRVAASDDAFLTDAELQDATGDYPEPPAAEPGQKYVAGLDVGLTGAWTGLVIGHADRAGIFTLDVLRSWTGRPGAPPSLESVERTIVELAAKFPLLALNADPWQMAYMGERLQKAGIPVKLQAIDAARVDRLVSGLKMLFVRRLVRFDRRLLELREQLDALSVTETRNRGLLRFEAGGSAGAGKYTDLVFSLALACESLSGSLGRLALPAQRACLRHLNNLPATCFLWTEAGSVPCDPLCHSSCPSWRAVKQAWLDAGGRDSVRTFYQQYFTGEANLMVKRQHMQGLLDQVNEWWGR